MRGVSVVISSQRSIGTATVSPIILQSGNTGKDRMTMCGSDSSGLLPHMANCDFAFVLVSRRSHQSNSRILPREIAVTLTLWSPASTDSRSCCDSCFGLVFTRGIKGSNLLYERSVIESCGVHITFHNRQPSLLVVGAINSRPVSSFGHTMGDIGLISLNI